MTNLFFKVFVLSTLFSSKMFVRADNSALMESLVQQIIESIIQEILSGNTTPSVEEPSLAGSSVDVEDYFKESDWNNLFTQLNYAQCDNKGNYKYSSFITAAKNWKSKGFLNSGDHQKDVRELAAFLAQTSHETTGGGNGWSEKWLGISRYEFGYCFWEEVGAAQSSKTYCEPSSKYSCAPGKLYYGRGPLQLSYNYNYGQFGEAIGNSKILEDPDLLTKEPSLGFEAAIWFWMTPQYTKPSCHNVINDVANSNKGPNGFGLVTSIINGGVECYGNSENEYSQDRIGFYDTYLNYFRISDNREKECHSIGGF